VTKRKTDPFDGHWFDLHGTELPLDELRVCLANEPEEIDPNPVIATIVREVALWRFDKARRDADPEPAQWSSLVPSLPEAPPSVSELCTVRRELQSLPVIVSGLLNSYIFQMTGTGWRGQIDPIIDTATEVAHGRADYDDRTLEQYQTLVAALSFFAEARYRVRRPHPDSGPALRAVTAAIQENSPLRKVRSAELAAYLLDLCGVRVPHGKSQILAKLK